MFEYLVKVAVDVENVEQQLKTAVQNGMRVINRHDNIVEMTAVVTNKAELDSMMGNLKYTAEVILQPDTSQLAKIRSSVAKAFDKIPVTLDTSKAMKQLKEFTKEAEELLEGSKVSDPSEFIRMKAPIVRDSKSPVVTARHVKELAGGLAAIRALPQDLRKNLTDQLVYDLTSRAALVEKQERQIMDSNDVTKKVGANMSKGMGNLIKTIEEIKELSPPSTRSGGSKDSVPKSDSGPKSGGGSSRGGGGDATPTTSTKAPKTPKGGGGGSNQGVQLLSFTDALKLARKDEKEFAKYVNDAFSAGSEKELLKSLGFDSQTVRRYLKKPELAIQRFMNRVNQGEVFRNYDENKQGKDNNPPTPTTPTIPTTSPAPTTPTGSSDKDVYSRLGLSKGGLLDRTTVLKLAKDDRGLLSEYIQAIFEDGQFKNLVKGLNLKQSDFTGKKGQEKLISRLVSDATHGDVFYDYDRTGSPEEAPQSSPKPQQPSQPSQPSVQDTVKDIFQEMGVEKGTILSIDQMRNMFRTYPKKGKEYFEALNDLGKIDEIRSLLGFSKSQFKGKNAIERMADVAEKRLGQGNVFRGYSDDYPFSDEGRLARIINSGKIGVSKADEDAIEKAISSLGVSALKDYPVGQLLGYIQKKHYDTKSGTLGATKDELIEYLNYRIFGEGRIKAVKNNSVLNKDGYTIPIKANGMGLDYDHYSGYSPYQLVRSLEFAQAISDSSTVDEIIKRGFSPDSFLRNYEPLVNAYRVLENGGHLAEAANPLNISAIQQLGAFANAYSKGQMTLDDMKSRYASVRSGPASGSSIPVKNLSAEAKNADITVQSGETPQQGSEPHTATPPTTPPTQTGSDNSTVVNPKSQGGDTSGGTTTDTIDVNAKKVNVDGSSQASGGGGGGGGGGKIPPTGSDTNGASNNGGGGGGGPKGPTYSGEVFDGDDDDKPISAQELLRYTSNLNNAAKNLVIAETTGNDTARMRSTLYREAAKDTESKLAERVRRHTDSQGIFHPEELTLAEQSALFAEEKTTGDAWRDLARSKTGYDKLQSQLDRIQQRADNANAPEALRMRMQELEQLSQMYDSTIMDATDRDKAYAAIQFGGEVSRIINDTNKNPYLQNVNTRRQAQVSASFEAWLAQNGKAKSVYSNDVENIRDMLVNADSRGLQNDTEQFIQNFKDVATREGNTGKSFIQELGSAFRNTGQYLMGYASIQRVAGWLKQGVNTVEQLDNAYMTLQQVSSESQSTLRAYQQESFGMADEVGTSAVQIQQSTADWLRLGKNFEEAKEYAKLSTQLLNVSEYENIGQATSALVSATQAYQDVDAKDIVDKLNYVGNSFAVNTSDLASGLANAGGVLAQQGNSLDEALALLTAGNLVGQDMSKASSGLRTIALRISGTELAKETLKSLGEDVSDFEVRTASKTDEQIRALTALPENNYQGVSVLNPNGSPRSTFDVFMDIASIFSKIQESDRANGTNRTSALTELMAGKNRSSIAASILANPETLKAVRDQSETMSAGYADRNLAIYNNSLEAAQKRFKNAASELAFSAMPSEGLSALANVGTLGLNALTALSNTFGGVQSIVGLGLSGILAKTGTMPLQYTKGQGLSFGLSKAFSEIGATLFKDAFTYNFADDAVRDFLTSAPGTSQLSGFISNQQAQNIAVPLAVSQFSNMYDGITVDQAIKGFEKNGQHVDGLAISKTLNKTGVFSTLATIGTTVASAAITTAAVSAGTWLVGKGIEGVSNWIHRDDIAIQEGQEARGRIAQVSSDYRGQEQFYNNNFADYIKLRGGVTYSNGELKNLKLSNDEYSKFLNLNNQMADIFPTLTTGFDSQGNAILGLSSNSKEATETMSDVMETYRTIASYKVGQDLPTAVSGALTEIRKLDTGIQENSEYLTDLSNIRNVLKAGTEGGIASLQEMGFSDDLSKFRFDYNATGDEAKLNNEIFKVLYNAGVAAYNRGASQGTDMNGDYYSVDVPLNATPEQNAKFYDLVTSGIQGIDLLEKYSEASAARAVDLQEQKAIWNGLVPSLIESMSLYDAYNSLGDSKVGNQLQQLIRDDITSMDYFSLSDAEKKSFEAEPRKFLRERYLDPISEAIMDESGNVSETALETIDNMLNPSGDTPLGKVIADRRSGAAGLVGKENADSLLSLLGISTDKTAEDLAMLSKVTRLPMSEFGSGKFTFDEFQTAVDLMNSPGWDYKIVDGQTIDNLKDYVAVNEEAITSTQQSPSFSSLLVDTDTEGKIQKTTDNLQTLTSTIDGYRDSISKGEMPNVVDMIQENGELAGYIDDYKDVASIMKGLDKLQLKGMKDFGTTFRDNISDLKGVDKEQAEDYIESLFSGIDMSGFAEESLQDQLKEFARGEAFKNIGKGSTHMDLVAASAQQESLLDQAMSAIGGDRTNLEAFTSLLLQGKTFGEALEGLSGFAEAYGNTQSQAKRLAEIQTGLQSLESTKSLADAVKENAELTRGYLTGKDYDGLIAANKTQQELLQANLDIAKEDVGDKYLDKMASNTTASVNAYGQAVDSYNTAKADLIASENEGIKLERERDEAELTNQTQALLDAQKYQSSRLQNMANQHLSDGRTISKQFAQELAESYKGEAVYANQQFGHFTQLASDYAEAGNEVLANQYRTTALGYLQEAQTAAQNASDATVLSEQSYIQKLQDGMTGLQAEATQLSDIMTLQQGKALNPTLEQYGKLTKNAEDQIDNLQRQNELQKAIYGNENLTYQTRKNALDNINANNSAIMSLLGNIQGWDDAQVAYYETIGKTGLSAVSTAIKESATATGVSAESMKVLNAQFADLEQMDTSTLFYNTAQGVRLDVNATRELVDAQHKLISNDLLTNINRQNKALQTQADLYAQTTDEAERKNIAANMEAGYRTMGQMYNQMAQYEAQYKQQQEQLSDYSAWVTAQETANAGAHYTSIQGYKKTAQDLYDKGLWGVDEFTSFVELMDTWGRDTAEAYNDVKPKLDRYFTEDGQGVLNFLSDLADQGYGTLDLANGKVDLNMPDSATAARALGISKEAYNEMWGRATDYGIQNQYVADALDGQLKLQENAQKLADTIVKRNEAAANGAPQDVIDQFDATIEEYRSARSGYVENIQDAIARENSISGKELQASVKTIEDLNTELQASSDVGEQNTFRNAIRNIAAQNGIPLDSNGNVDTAAMEQMYPGYKESGASYSTATNESLGGIFTGTAETLLQGSQAADRFSSSLMQMGNTSDDIKTLQGDLTSLGYTLDSDGVFGSATQQAVMQFQQAKGLVADGIVGAKTIAALNEELGYTSTDASQYAGVTNFDAMSMSSTELTQKLTDLGAARQELTTKVNQGTVAGQTALQQMDDTIAATQTQLNLQTQLEQMTARGTTIDSFLGMNSTAQTNLMSGLGVMEDQYQQFIATANAQSLRTTITSAIDRGDTSLEALSAMGDEELTATLHIDTSQAAEAQSIISEMSSEEIEVPMTVKLEDAQLDSIIGAINGEPVKLPVEADLTNIDGVSSAAPEPIQVPLEAGELDTSGIGGDIPPVEVNGQVGEIDTSAVQSIETTITATVETSGAESLDIPESTSVSVAVEQSGDVDIPTDVSVTATVTQSGNVDVPTSTTTIANVVQSGGVDIPTSVTVYAHVVTVGGVSTAQGTMSAFASGTVSDKYFKDAMSALASGSKVSLKNDHDALVNEVGTESLIKLFFCDLT